MVRVPSARMVTDAGPVDVVAPHTHLVSQALFSLSLFFQFISSSTIVETFLGVAVVQYTVLAVNPSRETSAHVNSHFCFLYSSG